MSLRNVALYNTGTDFISVVIPNGAIERELVSSPAAVTGGIQFIFAEDDNAVVRRSVTFRSKVPSYDPKAKTWSKGRREIACSDPVEVSPGIYQSLVVRVIVEAPAICTGDQILHSVDNAIQVAKHADTLQFLKLGTQD